MKSAVIHKKVGPFQMLALRLAESAKYRTLRKEYHSRTNRKDQGTQRPEELAS
jgi:hypothetical protein